MDRDALPSTAFRRLGSIASCLLAVGTAAHAQDLAPTQWVTDGVVYGEEVSGSTLYLGGLFSAIGRRAGPGVAIALPNGDVSPNSPLFDRNDAFVPYIHAVIADGSGGWYVGGFFDRVGGSVRRNLVHLDATLQATAWNPSPDAEVRSLALSGSTLYVGGAFQNIGGAPRNRLAAVDVATGIATAWNPNADGSVFTLAVGASAIYAGGGFSTIGGQSRYHLAALDPSSGLATGWDPNPADGNAVLALALSGSTVYVGGDFQSLGGSPRNEIGAVDATTGIATNWDPDANGMVAALRIVGSTIYAGGGFTHIGGRDRNRAAALRTTNGSATNWDPNFDLDVLALELSGSTLIAGGRFTHVGGQERLHIAGIDVATGNPTIWNPRLGFLLSAYDQVAAVAVAGSAAFAGGVFRVTGQSARTNLAAVDLAADQLTAWAPVADNIVRGFAIGSGVVYVRGDFANIGGQPRASLAALDATTGAATAWDPNPDDLVSALTLAGSTLYVGGGFTHIAGQQRNRAASFETGNGALTAWDPDVNSYVLAIAVDGPTAYLGGLFEHVDGVARGQIAAVDATSGDLLSWDPAGPVGGYDPLYGPVPPRILCLQAADGRLYAGGSFVSIGGQSCTNVAALDAATGAADLWTPGGTGGANWNIEFKVSALLVRGNEVVIGGEFFSMGDTGRTNLALVDASTGAASPWTPGPSEAVLDLAETPDGFVVAGGFQRISGVQAGGLADFVDAPVVGVPDPPMRATAIALSSVTPHPLGARGFVHFELARSGHVTLDLVDAAGRLVRTLVHATRFEAGPHAVPVDRSGLAPGFYLLRLRQGDDTATRKLIVPF